MTQNTQISSCWLTLRKEIHTSFKLATEWTRCCGLSTWVQPARATDSRFLQTWWLLSKSLRKKRGELLPLSKSKELMKAPAINQFCARRSPEAPSQPLEFWTKKALISGNEVRYSQRTNWSYTTNCHGPRFFSPNWPAETTALKEWKGNQHETPNSACDSSGGAVLGIDHSWFAFLLTLY